MQNLNSLLGHHTLLVLHSLDVNCNNTTIVAIVGITLHGMYSVICHGRIIEGEFNVGSMIGLIDVI